MKNGIAMISKLSKPVNSFIDTDMIGTSLRMNKKVKTVSPSAIETGMPVTMNAISSTKIVIARTDCGTTMMPVFCAMQIARIKSGAMMIGCRMQLIGSGNALDSRLAVMRQVAGPVVVPGHLQKAEAHQPGSQRDRRIDDPHRRFEIV